MVAIATTHARPLRIAFYGMLPSDNAATRLFCDRPRTYLTEEGVNSQLFLPSSPWLYNLFMGRVRGRRAFGAAYWYGVVVARRLVQIVRGLRSDVIFVQRSLFRPKSPPVLEALVWLLGRKLLGRRILYHLDDALYEVGPPLFFRLRCRFADRVLTGNADIARFARKAGGVVLLYDGAVEVDRYPHKVHRDSGPVVLGWVGNGPSYNLDPIIPALVRLCRERDVIIKIVSRERYEPGELESKVIWEQWRPAREFALFEDFDVGLMPLEDSAYNRGKEAFKIKEYMATGLPVVCSPVGHNVGVVEGGVTGFFAATLDEWFEALVRLVDDVALRARLGDSGRAAVAERWSLAQRAPELARLARALAEDDR
jgi:glycosyltransferase involved in cell wall biosynthesis